jgi:hypothetical protein
MIGQIGFRFKETSYGRAMRRYARNFLRITDQSQRPETGMNLRSNPWILGLVELKVKANFIRLALPANIDVA